MFTLLSCPSVLITCLASLAGDGLPSLVIRERDPLTGESKPLANVEVLFQEIGPDLGGLKNVRLVHEANPGEPLAYMQPKRATSDARGEFAFDSEYAHEQWAQAQGWLILFKPGYVPRKIEVDSCSFMATLEMTRGISTHTRLRVFPGAELGRALECSVQFPVSTPLGRCDLGKFPLRLDWRRDPDGGASIGFDTSGFGREDSTAIVFFEGYDAIEIGPSQPGEFVLRKERCLELRVCDWESGAPIEGVRPILRFGTLDEGGRFQPEQLYRFDHMNARLERDDRIRKGRLGSKGLCSSRILLPGESAAQITNLPHLDYMPMLYLAQRGQASPSPITILGPDAGTGSCTLYLKRR